MPGFRSRSQNALPVWLTDDDGNPLGSGTQSAASSMSVTPASDGAAFPVAGRYNSTPPLLADGAKGDIQISTAGMVGTYLARPSDGTGVSITSATSDGTVASGLGLFTNSRGFIFNGASWDRARGDLTGTWVHSPASAASSALSGTISASGGTAAITMTNVTRTEIINPSTGTLWASWGTPAVNGAGSFPITAGGSYNPPDRSAGTLTLLSTAATQPYTVNRFS